MKREKKSYDGCGNRKFTYIKFTGIAVAVVICVGLGSALYFGLSKRGSGQSLHKKSDGSEVPSCVGKQGLYGKATVVSDAPYCSVVGSDILKKNGSSIDAAIATALCIGVANAHSAGIGGGFLMTYYNRRNRKSYALDARETAPLASYKDMFVNNSAASTIGGLSIAVPGEVAGYMLAHKRFGKLPWHTLFEPAINLCDEGVPVTYGLYLAGKRVIRSIKANPLLKELFIDPKTNDIYTEGEKIKRPKLANTLRRIAKEGASSFYSGPIANDLLKDLEDQASPISAVDLSSYKPRWRKTLKVTLRGRETIHVPPPPSSGVLVSFMLAILDGYEFSPEFLKQCDGNTVLFYHRLIEAMKFGYASRSDLGDEDFVNVDGILMNLTNINYADDYRLRISDDTTYEPSYYGQKASKPADHGTAHFSIIAANGDAVSFSTTINFYFGSKTIGNRTGIIFNNEMDDFSSPGAPNHFGFPASPANFIQPRKRPMSSMSPLIVTDKNENIYAATGASGGSKIISATVYALTEFLWFGKSVKESIDASRLHHQWVPDVVVYEDDFPQEYVNLLKEKGHAVRALGKREAVVQMAVKDKCRKIHSYADARKGGCPDGY